MNRLFMLQNKHNQRKNIVFNIYDTQVMGLKNFNICYYKIFKFLREKVEEYDNNVECIKNCTKFDVYQNTCCNNHLKCDQHVTQLWNTISQLF